MTNEERRRASGAAMEASRRASGAAMEASRRAGGAAMIERRTGRAQVDDINALVKQPRASRTLKQLEPRGGVPAQVGRGNYTAPPAAGGGLAWPLTEDDAATRVFWSSQVISSADGLVAIQIKPLRTMMLRDANDSSGALSLAEP